MILGVDPKVDYAFKLMFGSLGCEPILIDVVEAALGARLAPPITAIEIANPFNNKDFFNDKLSILDIKAKDSAGRWYNVEMQMLPRRHFRHRVVYYGSTLHSQQLREGEDYHRLQDTFVISFVNGILFHEVPEYRLLFELRNREHPELLFSPQLSICLIELPKFQLPVESLSTSLERWCYLLRHGEGLDTAQLPVQLKSPMIEKAVEMLSMMSQTPIERERYEARLKAQRDYSSDLKDARLEGIVEGKREGKREGVLEGKRGATCNKLEKLLQFKFGSAGQEFLDRLRGLPEIADLDRAFDALLLAGTPEEFRQVMANIPEKTT